MKSIPPKPIAEFDLSSLSVAELIKKLEKGDPYALAVVNVILAAIARGYNKCCVCDSRDIEWDKDGDGQPYYRCKDCGHESQ